MSRQSPESAAESESPTESRSSLREELLRTALHMVQTEGIDAISVREVARRAGVSSGAPFRHFKDRNALLAAIAHDGRLRLEEVLLAALAEIDDDPVKQMKAIGIAHVRFAIRHPAHFRVMHHPALVVDEYPEIAKRTALEEQKLRALIVEGQARGVLRNADPDLLALMAISVVSGLARLFVDGGRHCPIDLSTHSLDEVDALVASVIELSGLGVVDPAVQESYAKTLPASVRGRKRRAAPARTSDAPATRARTASKARSRSS